MDVKLAAALKRDDRREDGGMHADNRETCWRCQSWSDHAHDPITSERITYAEYLDIKRNRGF